MDQGISVDKAKYLRLKIAQSHYKLVLEDDSSQKKKHFNALNALVVEFLDNTNHHQKFNYSEIIEILHRNVVENSEFNAYSAKQAFEALEKYACNILYYPWRKEFRIIKIYSGFYKMSVDTKLLYGDVLIKLLGYVKHEGTAFILNGSPITLRDNLSKLSLDFFIAQIECSLLAKIFEKVKQHNISWAEILQARQSHIGSVDSCVSFLLKSKSQIIEENLIHIDTQPERKDRNCNYPEKKRFDWNSHSPSIYHRSKPLDSVTNKTNGKHLLDMDDLGLEDDDDISPLSHSPPLARVHHLEPIRISSNSSVLSDVDIKPSHNRPGHSRTISDPRELNLSAAMGKNWLVRSDQDFSNSLMQARQEKEVADFVANSSISKRRSDGRGSSNSAIFPEGTFDDHLEASLRLLKDKEKLKKDEKKDNWDFVYSALQSQGYSKDVSDRGDILEKLSEPFKSLSQFQKTRGTTQNACYATLSNSSNQRSFVSGLKDHRSSWIADESARRSLGDYIESSKDVHLRKSHVNEPRTKLEYLRAHRYSADSCPINDPSFTQRLNQSFREGNYSLDNVNTFFKSPKSGSSGLDYAEISSHPSFSKIRVDRHKSSYNDLTSGEYNQSSDARDIHYHNWADNAHGNTGESEHFLSSSLSNSGKFSSKHSSEKLHYSSVRLNVGSTASLSRQSSGEERFQKADLIDRTKEEFFSNTRLSSGSKSHQWECRHCTYMNVSDSRKCEMCSQTRSFTKSGNSYMCYHCTFLNDKSDTKCQACSKELKGYTTYI